MRYTVTYWLGTEQRTEHVNTEQEALRLIAQNRNAFDPSVWIDGREAGVLVDDSGQPHICVVAE